MIIRKVAKYTALITFANADSVGERRNLEKNLIRLAIVGASMT